MTVKKEIYEHLQKHIVYPTTKKEIIEACNMMMDVPQANKEWFEKYLPDRIYNNPDDACMHARFSHDSLWHFSFCLFSPSILCVCSFEKK